MHFSTSLLVILTFGLYTVTSDSIIPPPPGTQCVGEKNAGLGPAVRELVDLLPANDLLLIYLNAVSNDAEVEEAMEYLQSSDFMKIVVTMHNTPEFSNVMEYICEELKFDAYFYLNSLGDLLGYPQMTRPPQINRIRRNRKFSRPGLEGMLEDLRDAIPLEELRKVYRQRYKNDKYLRLAMEKLGSDEFRRVGDAIEALPEYQNMLYRLRQVGVDVDKILNAIMKFFHWERKNN